MMNPTKFHHESTVIKYAIRSRLLVISLVILWRTLLTPYDTSAPLNPTCLSQQQHPNVVADDDQHVMLPRVASAIESSIVWDSVYFVRIAQGGYEYEQSYAFFPLLPICISWLSRKVLAPLVPMIGHRAVLGLSGYVINNVGFVFAALYLYRLSVIILKHQEAALRASILFCFNPASISIHQYTRRLCSPYSHLEDCTV